MSSGRFATVLALCLTLAGCASFNITEDFWFNPGFAVLDADALREAERVLPGNQTLEVLHVTAADGTPLYGLRMRVDPAWPTVLYFGGDSFRIAEDGIDVLRDFAALDVNVVMMDYRGYGGSGGEPGLNALHADALTAYRHLHKNLHIERIVLHGFSMGSFIAAGMVDDVAPMALVLEGTATNVPDWADFQVPWYAEPFVTLDIADALLEQDNRRRLRSYRGPLLLIAGGMDRITPVPMSRELFEEAVTPAANKQLLVSVTGRHGNAMQDVAIVDGYREFLRRRLE